MFEYETTAKASLVLRFGFEGMTHAPMISFPATDSRSDSGERQWTVNAELLTDCLSWETQSRPSCYGPNTLRKNPSFGGGGSSLPVPSYLSMGNRAFSPGAAKHCSAHKKVAWTTSSNETPKSRGRL